MTLRPLKVKIKCCKDHDWYLVGNTWWKCRKCLRLIEMESQPAPDIELKEIEFRDR